MDRQTPFVVALACLLGTLTMIHAVSGQRIEFVTVPSPAPLRVGDDVDLRATVSIEPGTAGMAMPVGIAWAGRGNQFYVCNYESLALVDLDTGTMLPIPKPAGLSSAWVPTGLAFCPTTNELVIANYTGGNLVVLDVSNPHGAELAAEVFHPELVGAEGVAVTANGQSMAVADYDAGCISMFHRDGRLQWIVRDVPRAHGIAISGQPGQEFIVVAALGRRELVSVDMDGKMIARTKPPVRMPSGTEAFLYPTGVATSSNGTLVVTDAFRGQVIRASPNLRVHTAIGGNGPSLRLLNNPYASVVNPVTGHLVVTDTFRNRLVELDPQSGTITRSLFLTHSPESRWMENSTPFVGHDRGVRRPPRPSVPGAHFPGTLLPCTLGDEAQPVLFRTQEVCFPQSGIVCHTQGMSPLFGTYTWRFLEHRSGHVDGEKCLLLWSSQSAGAILLWRGVAIPLDLPADVWSVDGQLVRRDSVLDDDRISEILEEATDRGRAYLLACREMTPVRAMHRELFPAIDEGRFLSNLLLAGWTAAGKRFMRKLVSGVDDTAVQRRSTGRYVESVRPGTVGLAEVLIAETIHSGMNAAENSRSDESNPETETRRLAGEPHAHHAALRP